LRGQGGAKLAEFRSTTKRKNFSWVQKSRACPETARVAPSELHEGAQNSVGEFCAPSPFPERNAENPSQRWCGHDQRHVVSQSVETLSDRCIFSILAGLFTFLNESEFAS
jgi:hypothetical protein